MRSSEYDSKTKKNKTGLIIAIIILIIIAVICAVVVINKKNKPQQAVTPVEESTVTENSDTEEETPVSKAVEKAKIKRITNVALFGLDAREGETKSRSDAIMVLSVNPFNNSIKLISVMRDSYVDIGDGYMDKINHAYFYDGPEGAVAVLNNNFDLDITDYVTTDFNSLAKIVDYIGGVDVEIDEDERAYMSLPQSGKVHFTGAQAVGYSRIRYIGTDRARTARQRKVMLAMLDVIMKKDASELPDIVRYILSTVDTSMSYSEMSEFLPILDSTVATDQIMIPGKHDSPKDEYIDGVYYMVFDIDSATQHIHDFIYEDINPDNAE